MKCIFNSFVSFDARQKATKIQKFEEREEKMRCLILQAADQLATSVPFLNYASHFLKLFVSFLNSEIEF